MLETISFAAGIGIHVQDCTLEPPERVVVHDDWDSGGLETVALVRRVFVDRDSKAVATAAQEMAHRENRPRKVGL